MTSETAPERIWAQDADPSECNYIGGGWWDDECGNVQYSNTVEYTRTDIHRAAIAKKDARIAELEAVLQGIVDLGGTTGSALFAETVDRAARRALAEKEGE